MRGVGKDFIEEMTFELSLKRDHQVFSKGKGKRRGNSAKAGVKQF